MILKLPALLAVLPFVRQSAQVEVVEPGVSVSTNVVIMRDAGIEVSRMDVVAVIAAAAREIDDARRSVRSQGALEKLDHARDMLRDVEEFFTN